MSIGADIRKVAEHYGLQAQSRQLIEEMSELTQVICKMEREGEMTTNRKKDFVDELTDVLFVARQLEYLIGHELVADRLKYKIERQLARMERGR